MNNKMEPQKYSIDEIIQQFHHSNNFDEIIDGMNALQEMQVTGQISSEEQLEQQLLAFDSLHNLLGIDKNKIEEIQKTVLNYLLPNCYKTKVSAPNLRYRYTTTLVEWINELIGADIREIRSQLLKKLGSDLNTDHSSDACGIISQLGYREDNIVETLWTIIQENDNEKGDLALSTLSWLEYSPVKKTKLIRELLLRIEKRYNDSLVWATARLGNPDSFWIILNQWLQKEKISGKGVDAALAFTAIREIAEDNEDDLAFQDKIWEENAKLVEENHEGLYFDFTIGHLTTTCNSTLIVPTLLRWHGQHPEWFPKEEERQWARYLAQNQLESAIKPLQIAGWSQIEDQKIFEYLENDALLDTGSDNFYTTQTWMIKEAAWKTILRAGYPKALTWFEPAVVAEKGRFIRKEIMDYLAAFKIEPLPETIINLITEEIDDLADTDGRELGYRMGAVRLARSHASMNAFKVLLDFGYTRNGQVLQQSVSAVAEVSVSLLREGKIEVINTLTNLAIKSEKERSRVAAVHTLEVISSFPEYLLILSPYQAQLLPLVYETERKDFERGQLLRIIARLPNDIPEKFEKDLVTWTDESDTWVKSGSIDALAQHEKLETYPELMRNMLNIEKDKNEWKCLPGKSQFEWAAFEIGVLYSKHPENYSKVVSSLIESGNQDWRTIIQIVAWLKTTHLGEGKPKLQKNVGDALLYRLIHKMSQFYSETGTFDALAKLAPDNLINDELAKVMLNWMPDSRVALANALQNAKISQVLYSRCLVMLESLVDDSMYSVRRAAYRAIAKYSSLHLLNLCKSWISSPILKLNMRAAEGCGWLENINSEHEQEFKDLKNACFQHQELNVREAIKRSWKERRHRQWGKLYLEKVLAVQGKSNDEVLQAWRFGDALTRVGDDETCQFLNEHLTYKELPPNVRFWLSKQVVEPLENNWKKVTQKWPEPWTEASGALERGTGKLIINSDDITEIQYSIWLDPAATPREKHSWGGTMLFSLGFGFFKFQKSTIMLELEDGRKGNIYLEGSTGDTTTFFGSGAYPS